MAQNLVKFKSLSKSEFNALSTKNQNMLYFISDTKQIFKGNVEYCAANTANGVLILKGILTADTSGVIAIPSEFQKGYIYMLPAGKFEGNTVEEGDLAIAIADSSSTASQGGQTTDAATNYFVVVKSATNIDEAEWEE